MIQIFINDDITEKLFLILNVIKNKEGVKMNYFFYEVEHFYKDGGPSWTVTMQFPEEMRGEVEVISQMAVPLKRLIQIGN